MIKSFVWSVATPLWHAPDELAHYLYADILERESALVLNKSYLLPYSIYKSIAASNYYSHNFDKKRYLYDGKYAPFEKNIDAVTDPAEAKDLFLSLPPVDLEAITAPWEPEIVKERDDSVSYDISFLFTKAKEPVLIYCRKYKGEFQMNTPMEKSTGFLFIDNKLDETLIVGDGQDASIKGMIATFAKRPDERLAVRALPIGWEKRDYFTHVNMYPPLYYMIVAGIQRAVRCFGASIINDHFFSRLFSVFLSVIAVFFVYGSFKVVWPDDERCAIAGTLLFSFWPQNSFVSGTINPEALLNLFCTVSFYYIVRILFAKDESSAKDWALFALAASLAALSKVSGILLISIWGAILVLWAIYKEGKLRAVYFLPGILMFFGAYLLWFKQRGFGVLAPMALVDFSLPQYIAYYIQNPMPLFKTFAGFFGALKNPMPTPAYYILILFIIIMLFFFIYAMINNIHKERRKRFAILFVSVTLSFLFFFVMEFLRLKSTGLVLQGRYFLFLALPLTIIALAGIEQKDGRMRRYANIMLDLFVLTVLSMNVYALVNYAAQNYNL